MRSKNEATKHNYWQQRENTFFFTSGIVLDREKIVIEIDMNSACGKVEKVGRKSQRTRLHDRTTAVYRTAVYRTAVYRTAVYRTDVYRTAVYATPTVACRLARAVVIL